MRSIDMDERQTLPYRHRWTEARGFFPQDEELNARPVGIELVPGELNFGQLRYRSVSSNQMNEENGLN